MMEKTEEKPTRPLPSPAEETLKEKGPFGLIGGIFMILGGIGFITLGILAGVVAGVAASFGVVGLLTSAFCAVLFILGIIELIGGIFAIKRTHWLFALIVAILGLNVLGIIFVAVGRKEFK